MHRTQVLIPPGLHRRAARAARARGVSLGALVREALEAWLAAKPPANEDEDSLTAVLLSDPFIDPHPDPRLSKDVDHYLYGAPRRSRRRP